ncbi:DoxX family protein [Glaciihabitans sp. GrIS 2.15]|uniref:DoxX family protein n=1 Tax=Glaciihabitans sp. GrIS 2.15 TaxID=3071710 RepID=UPI002E01A89E|nr:putative membrane protein [Glaciihabitans sp. GrIS 2.15]
MSLPSTKRSSVARTAGRLLLGAFLLLAGISHLTVSRMAFRAQVPRWVPVDADFVVLSSGIVEITLGLALLLLVRRQVIVGVIVAVFFLLVFPGNISQLVTHTNSFGLNTDLARGIRLLFQPLLVVWALWSTGAWSAIQNRPRQA